MANFIKLQTSDLPNHIEHYSNGERTVAYRPSEKNTANIRFYIDGAEVDSQDFNGYSQLCDAKNMIIAFLFETIVEAGFSYEAFINQGVRICTVEKATKTRYRAYYEMPNSGIKGAWRKSFIIGGTAYISDINY